MMNEGECEDPVMLSRFLGEGSDIAFLQLSLRASQINNAMCLMHEPFPDQSLDRRITQAAEGDE